MPVEAALQGYKGEGMDPGVGSPQDPCISLRCREPSGFVATSHWLQRFLEGHLTDYSCPSASCFLGLLLRREHPDLPRAALHDLANSEDKNSICAEIFVGRKGGTTGKGQGIGFSAGDSVRRYIFAC